MRGGEGRGEEEEESPFFTPVSYQKEIDKRKKIYNVEEALILFQDLSKGESDGSEVSDLGDEDWVEKESSDSEPEPLPLKKTKKSPSADISRSTPEE